MASNETRVAPLVMGNMAANATWTSPTRDRLMGEYMFRRVRAEIWAPQAGTLYLDVWDKEDKSDVASTAFAVAANTTVPTAWTEVTKRFFGWRFVNGAAANSGIVAFEEKAGRPLADVSLMGSNLTQAPGSPVAGKDVALLGASDGTNAQGLRVDASKNLLAALPNIEGTPGQAIPSKAALIAGQSSGGAAIVPRVYPLADGASLSDVGVIVNARLQAYNGAALDMVRVANKQASIGVTGVAAAASTTLITPSTNKKWRLVFLSIRVSVAGRYSIIDGAGGLHALYLPANETRIIQFPANFLLSAAVNNICAIKNETAGNADITALALYLEE